VRRLDPVRVVDDQRLVEREPRLPRLVREVAGEGVARSGLPEEIGIGMAAERVHGPPPHAASPAAPSPSGGVTRISTQHGDIPLSQRLSARRPSAGVDASKRPREYPAPQGTGFLASIEEIALARLVLMISLLAALLPGSAAAAVVTAAGDIASCAWAGDAATGHIVRSIDPAVALTLGDNVYPDGARARFANCYAPAWGSFKRKTRPSPGNHDYVTANAAGYFGYFGARAGPCCRGYYKYDVGKWRLYSLNSERNIATQTTWLAKDLRAHPRRCTLAYWHRPRFSDSSRHGDSMAVDPLWDAFAANGGDLVLAGHDHDYQRFPRRDGVRPFVVGTGGAPLYDVVPRRVAAHDDSHRGVLRLGLHDGYYSWSFRRVGAPVFDRGSANCRS
jgi:hypothetical protein